MKCCVHITFFYNNNRIKYINEIINEISKYPFLTDIFIHTNINFDINLLNNYNNGKIEIIVHSLEDIHPYYLAWKCRILLKKQVNDYDIFMYIEDDILVPKNAIIYWLKYKNNLYKNGYNLGFIRIECDNNKILYCTDIPTKRRLKKLITINNQKYVVNKSYTYCAFWIYDKKEFTKWTNSDIYDLNKYYDKYFSNPKLIREKSSIGLHSKYNNWYKYTVIPIINSKICEDCKIFHLSNNYVNMKNTRLAKLKFSKCLVNI